MNAIEELATRKSKYRVIADTFREQIVSGKLPMGTRLRPDSELAQKYSVNKRTIAIGLNTLVKEGLLERAPSRGTIVIKDFSKEVSTTNAVGIVMISKGDVHNDIAHNIAKGLQKHKLVPFAINNDFVVEASFNSPCIVNFLRTMNGDKTRPYGFIIDGSLLFPFEFLKEHIKDFSNVVFITKYHYPEKIFGARYALVDFTEAGRLAARHFISKGYKKLAFLALHEMSYAGPWSSMQVQIMQGFAEVCRESSIKFNKDIFWKLLHGAPLAETVNKLLSGANRPDAIFAYNDSFISYKLLPLLNNAKDIELIGFYNTPHAEKYGFSSICIHEEKIAENAVRLLTNKTTEREVLIKPELIVRGQ